MNTTKNQNQSPLHLPPTTCPSPFRESEPLFSDLVGANSLSLSYETGSMNAVSWDQRRRNSLCWRLLVPSRALFPRLLFPPTLGFTARANCPLWWLVPQLHTPFFRRKHYFEHRHGPRLKRGHFVTSSCIELFCLFSLVSDSACPIPCQTLVGLLCCSVDCSPSCLLYVYVLVFVLGSKPESNLFHDLASK
jgi:hypothetical protein